MKTDMKRNFWIWVMIANVIIGFIVGGALFSQMPEMMASHWNASGEADGYISRFWGVFLFPFISLGLLLLLLVIPKIDPLRTNIEKFKGYYYGFAAVFLVYFLYIYILTLIWSLDVRFDMNRALMPAIGILFIVAGIMMGKAKRNYLIGIRTPWTLSNDEVWNRTHKLGSRLFIITGFIVALLAIFITSTVVYVMLGLVLATALISIIYSYVVYKRLEKAGKINLDQNNKS
jgi:uncharacterized membrane protein